MPWVGKSMDRKASLRRMHAVPKHKPSKCRRLMTRVCHCIVVTDRTFHACCGWYCDGCGGRLAEAVVREMGGRR